MGWMDTIGGLLKQYTGENARVGDPETHFDQVTSSVPSSTLGGAVADMLRSSDTPPFAQLAAQMFGNANSGQKASVLNELFSTAGSALPSILGNAGLGALASAFARNGTITPEAAEQVSPEVLQQVAQHAEKHDPSVVDRLGSIYSEHPTLIKTLGSAALAVTLAKLANRTQG